METAIQRAKAEGKCQRCERPIPSNYNLLYCPKCRQGSIKEYLAHGCPKSKMFEVDGKRVDTWNPIVYRCSYGCSYCYAQALLDGRLKNTVKYLRNL